MARLRPLSILAFLAACDTPAGDDSAPDFNFIPINDEVCVPETESAWTSASAAVDTFTTGDADGDLIVDYTAYVVRDLELCEAASAGECAGCAENPMRDLLDAIDALEWQAEGDNAITPARTVDYFREALQYPARELTLLVDPVDASTAAVVLAQSAEVACVGCDAPIMRVQVESLSTDCATPSLSFAAALAAEGDGHRVQTLAGTQTFGFVVPLVDTFPDPASFTSVYALQLWAQAQPGYSVAAQSPVPSALIDSEGGGCFTMDAYVPLGNILDGLQDSWKETVVGLVSDGGYEDSAHPGTVRAILRGRLEAAVVNNGVVIPGGAE